MHQPFTWHAQSFTDYFNMQPSDVKGAINANSGYQRRWLYQKLISVLEFKLPEEWPGNWFRFWLYQAGSIAVVYTREFGWVCMPYGIQKLGFYYQPAEITIAHPELSITKVGVIGVNAVILHLFDDYFGINDIVNKYAEMIAQIDKSININLMNANVGLLAEVKDKKAGDGIKEAYARATSGTPLTVINDRLLDGKKLDYLFPDVKQRYIVNDLLTSRQMVINQFLTDVGINNANTAKKERMITDEVNGNNMEIRSIPSIMVRNLEKGFLQLSKIGGPALSVNIRYERSDNYGI